MLEVDSRFTSNLDALGLAACPVDATTFDMAGIILAGNSEAARLDTTGATLTNLDASGGYGSPIVIDGTTEIAPSHGIETFIFTAAFAEGNDIVDDIKVFDDPRKVTRAMARVPGPKKLMFNSTADSSRYQWDDDGEGPFELLDVTVAGRGATTSGNTPRVEFNDNVVLANFRRVGGNVRLHNSNDINALVSDFALESGATQPGGTTNLFDFGTMEGPFPEIFNDGTQPFFDFSTMGRGGAFRVAGRIRGSSPAFSFGASDKGLSFPAFFGGVIDSLMFSGSVAKHNWFPNSSSAAIGSDQSLLTGTALIVHQNANKDQMPMRPQLPAVPSVTPLLLSSGDQNLRLQWTTHGRVDTSGGDHGQLVPAMTESGRLTFGQKMAVTNFGSSGKSTLIPEAGTTFDGVAAVAATEVLTFTGNPADADEVELGGKTYTFVDRFAVTASLTFDDDPGGGNSLITGANFTGVLTGDDVTISGTASNDGTYTANANGDGTSLELTGVVLTDEGPVSSTVAAIDNTDGNVLRDASVTATTIANLDAAISLGSGAGTLYASDTTKIDDVVTVASDATTLTASALSTYGNTITCTDPTDGGGVMSWGAVVLSGGTGGFELHFGETIEVRSDGGTDRIIKSLAGDGGREQTVSAPGALDPTVDFVDLQVDGTDAFTLADGARKGHEISVRCTVADNTPVGTLTPANFGDGTSILFNAVGESLRLLWNGATWRATDANGATIS